MSDYQIELGKNLREHLAQDNLTQSYLSRKVGIRKTTLHSYLYGVIPKGLENVVRLAQYFQLSLDELILGTKSENPKVGDIIEEYDLLIIKKTDRNNNQQSQNGKVERGMSY